MRPRSLAAAAAALLAAAIAAAGAGGARAARAATDPFYLDLLRDGMLSYDRADYPAAVKQLRLACFGMLDEPERLAGCLTRLALAQAAAGATDSFRETFRRIVEVEDRFGAYSRADLPPEVRAAFEQRALAAVPATTLEAIPAWRALLARKLEAQIAALPPRERRRQLEERLAREPRSVAWNAMLAELDLAEGKVAPALTRAEAAAAAAPRDTRALCVRGLARAAAGRRCGEVVADLEPCPFCATDERYAAALLGCRVELGQWQQAEDQVRSLPAALRQDRRLAALAQQVAKRPAPPPVKQPPAAAATRGGPGSAPAASSTAAPGPAPKVGGAPGPGPAPAPRASTSTQTPQTAATDPPGLTGSSRSAAPPPGGTSSAGLAGSGPASLSAAEREAMARSERLLTASNMADLRESLRLARQVADDHPEIKEAQYLAGEAAYRSSRWSEAAAYFRRGGPPGDDRPELLFYMAVAFYEAGDRPAAGTALKRALPNLQRTPFVQSYVQRILGQ
jgi:tetratricopeptide (TPR) repeat protein